mmetsp:Transcript_17125/g.17009  ORF Transcript_17125/g.17009 Transcript_17125/m.17009 type:complete len:417 (-) Transcript_17125:38-1288(-)
MNGIRFHIGSEKIQIVECPSTFSALCSLVEQNVPHYQISQITYEDADGDFIAIKNDEDFVEAIKIGKKINGVLLLHLKGTILSQSFMTHSIKEKTFSDVEVIEEEHQAFQSPQSPFEIDYLVPCYACDGKFEKCLLCSGSGLVDASQDPKLKQILQSEIENYLPRVKQSVENNKSEIVQERVTCDSCGVSPIIGHRYKCSVCQNFDFCSKCEASVDHEHPFIKIRTQEQAPKTIFCALDEQEPKPKPKAGLKCFKKQCTQDTRLLCSFVKNITGTDSDEVIAGSNYSKTWRLRNDGKNSWPIGCTLVCIKGDAIEGATPLPPLKSGEEANITVTFTAPTEEGRYTSFWRAADPAGTKFGQRVWSTILVTKPKDQFAEKTQALIEMFNNPELVKLALEKAGGDLMKATEALLNGSVL